MQPLCQISKKLYGKSKPCNNLRLVSLAPVWLGTGVLHQPLASLLMHLPRTNALSLGSRGPLDSGALLTSPHRIVMCVSLRTWGSDGFISAWSIIATQLFSEFLCVAVWCCVLSLSPKMLHSRLIWTLPWIGYPKIEKVLLALAWSSRLFQ